MALGFGKNAKKDAPPDLFVPPPSEIPPPIVSRKKPSLPLMLGGAGLLVVALLGAVFVSMQSPDESEAPAVVPPRRLAKSKTTLPPTRVAKPNAIARPVVRPVVVRPVIVKPVVRPAIVRPVIVRPPGVVSRTVSVRRTKVVAVVPRVKGRPAVIKLAPRVILPVPTPTQPKAITTPVHYPPPGASPGVQVVRSQVRRIVRRTIRPAPAAWYLELKLLWNAGREAKHRLDYDGARRAWHKGLALASMRPAAAQSARGFRQALAKLPKSKVRR